MEEDVDTTHLMNVRSAEYSKEQYYVSQKLKHGEVNLNNFDLTSEQAEEVESRNALRFYLEGVEEGLYKKVMDNIGSPEVLEKLSPSIESGKGLRHRMGDHYHIPICSTNEHFFLNYDTGRYSAIKIFLKVFVKGNDPTKKQKEYINEKEYSEFYSKRPNNPVKLISHHETKDLCFLALPYVECTFVELGERQSYNLQELLTASTVSKGFGNLLAAIPDIAEHHVWGTEHMDELKIIPDPDDLVTYFDNRVSKRFCEDCGSSPEFERFRDYVIEKKIKELQKLPTFLINDDLHPLNVIFDGSHFSVIDHAKTKKGKNVDDLGRLFMYFSLNRNLRGSVIDTAIDRSFDYNKRVIMDSTLDNDKYLVDSDTWKNSIRMFMPYNAILDTFGKLYDVKTYPQLQEYSLDLGMKLFQNLMLDCDARDPKMKKLFVEALKKQNNHYGNYLKNFHERIVPML